MQSTLFTATRLLSERTWPLLLVTVGALSSLYYTCTVPLIAFAAVAGITLGRNRALLVVSGIWLANQILGYTLHQYPQTPVSFAWGGILGLGALLVTVAALAMRSAKAVPRPFAVLLALIGGFACYEGLILLASIGLGSLDSFTPAIVAGIFLTNALWVGGLSAVHALLDRSVR